MDKFKQIIEGGYGGFSTSDAQSILRNSAEVSLYVEEKREHLNYVSQLMNDKIIDEAMGRVKAKGDFVFNREEGTFSYRPNQIQTRQVLSEQYPTQPVYPSYRQQQTPQDNVAARLDAMEREMRALREENQALKSRYEMLK